MFNPLSHIKLLTVSLLATFCLSASLAVAGPIQDASAAGHAVQVAKKKPKPKPCKKVCSGGGSSWWSEE